MALDNPKHVERYKFPKGQWPNIYSKYLSGHVFYQIKDDHILVKTSSKYAKDIMKQLGIKPELKPEQNEKN